MLRLHLLTALLLSIPLAASALAAEPSDSPRESKPICHVVCLKFKESATPEQIKAIETAFRALKDQVPGVVSLEWGTNVSPENRNKGFTHCFILKFANTRDRDGYLTHPAHKRFGELLGPVLGDVFVIDFSPEG